MPITVTESAAAQIRNSVAKLGGIGLKLGVKRVGCSGLAYTFDIAKEVGADEHVFEWHDAKLVVPNDALAILDGSQLDFVREGFKQMFSVRNPNAKATCGCGESFTV
jgi:iron-sulfur cluster assembly protein